MKIKVFQILCIVSFFIFFGYFFGDEYWEYQNDGEVRETYVSNIQEQIGEFYPEELEDFTERVELHVTPDLGLLDTLVNEIDTAKEKIYVEVYIFTERDMRDALIRAHKRGVDVKILLENNPYKSPYLNDKHYESFLSAGIDVRWSDPLNYSLNHSKLLIIDNTAYISTGNFSYSLFKYNRDFLIRFNEEEFVNVLQQLFIQDFKHIHMGVYHKNLVLSPDYSRDKLTNIITGAQESIDFYFPYLQDNAFQKALFERGRAGVKIRGLVEKKFHIENQQIIKDFKENNIALFPLVGDKLHAKAMLIDDTYLYIGSINFSQFSFDENREIGVIISNTEIIKKFKKVFESDVEI